VVGLAWSVGGFCLRSPSGNCGDAETIRWLTLGDHRFSGNVNEIIKAFGSDIESNNSLMSLRYEKFAIFSTEMFWVSSVLRD
jgi:hypothetical protein